MAIDSGSCRPWLNPNRSAEGAWPAWTRGRMSSSCGCMMKMASGIGTNANTKPWSTGRSGRTDQKKLGVEDGPDRADDQVQRHADDPARPYARMRQRHASERADDVDEGYARQDERPGHGLPGDGARHAG